MAYVYRYIDIQKKECIYVGIVKKSKDGAYDPLIQRHNQHKYNDAWYKEHGGIGNVAMQFIETESIGDADILETVYINFYSQTGQLYNKDKADGGGIHIVDCEAIIKEYEPLWFPFGIRQKWFSGTGAGIEMIESISAVFIDAEKLAIQLVDKKIRTYATEKDSFTEEGIRILAETVKTRLIEDLNEIRLADALIKGSPFLRETENGID